MFLEAKVGGKFYEIFADNNDNGQVLADIIFVDAPNKIILKGPFFFMGSAINMVVTWEIEEYYDYVAF